IELGAVAGRERRRLADRLIGDERAQNAGGAALGERELLAQRQWRGAVRDAEDEEAAHRSPWRTASISCSRSRISPTSWSGGRSRGLSASSASEPSSRWMRLSLAAMIAT